MEINSENLNKHFFNNFLETIKLKKNIKNSKTHKKKMEADGSLLFRTTAGEPEGVRALAGHYECRAESAAGEASVAVDVRPISLLHFFVGIFIRFFSILF
jgi:hypothetical protein